MVNVARYYYNKTVYVSDKEDDIYNNVYKGLDITKVANYKLESLIMPIKPARIQISTKKD